MRRLAASFALALVACGRGGEHPGEDSVASATTPSDPRPAPPAALHGPLGALVDSILGPVHGWRCMYLGASEGSDSTLSLPGAAARVAGLARACTALSGRAGARWLVVAPGDTVLGATLIDYAPDSASARRSFDSLVAATVRARGQPVRTCEGEAPDARAGRPLRYAVAEWALVDSARLSVLWSISAASAGVSTLLGSAKSQCDRPARA